MRRPIWCRAYLRLLEEETEGRVELAAERAGVTARSVFYRRAADETFLRDEQAVFDRLAERRAEAALRNSRGTRKASTVTRARGVVEVEKKVASGE